MAEQSTKEVDFSPREHARRRQQEKRKELHKNIERGRRKRKRCSPTHQRR